VHGTDEYPFLISSEGITVLPITSLSLNHRASTKRISSGIPRLDTMLGGEGYYRGSSVLFTGQAGTGKTSFLAAAMDAACRRGEGCLWMAFEESPSQILRNMESIGIDLGPWVRKGLLHINAVRPTAYSLEMHLALILKMIRDYKPSILAIDPISNLFPVGDDMQVRAMLMRLIDHAKSEGITGLFTSLSAGPSGSLTAIEPTTMHVSSLMDTWIMLKAVEGNGERNRALCVTKSRGTAHSNQLREYLLSDRGIELLDVYMGSSGVLFGSARINQENREKAEQLLREQETEKNKRELERKKRIMEAEITAIRERYGRNEQERDILIREAETREDVTTRDRADMRLYRKGDV